MILTIWIPIAAGIVQVLAFYWVWCQVRELRRELNAIIAVMREIPHVPEAVLGALARKGDPNRVRQ